MPLERDRVCCVCGEETDPSDYGVDWRGKYCATCFAQRPGMQVVAVELPPNGSHLPKTSSDG